MRTEVKKWLLDPGIEIPPETTAIHGVTTQHARDHGLPAVVGLTQIATELGTHLASGAPLVVYNASFDIPLLEVELERHGLPSLSHHAGRQDYPVLDPLVLDRWVDRYRKGKRRLGDLVAHYGVSIIDELHNADADVVATLDVLEEMMERHPAIAATALDQLRAIQANAHFEWAENFNQWLRTQGSLKPGPSVNWI
jgi:DNA polymerase-3 subunit epsilon